MTTNLKPRQGQCILNKNTNEIYSVVGYIKIDDMCDYDHTKDDKFILSQEDAVKFENTVINIILKSKTCKIKNDYFYSFPFMNDNFTVVNNPKFDMCDYVTTAKIKRGQIVGMYYHQHRQSYVYTITNLDDDKQYRNNKEEDIQPFDSNEMMKFILEKISKQEEQISQLQFHVDCIKKYRHY